MKLDDLGHYIVDTNKLDSETDELGIISASRITIGIYDSGSDENHSNHIISVMVSLVIKDRVSFEYTELTTITGLSVVSLDVKDYCWIKLKVTKIEGTPSNSIILLNSFS